MGDEKKVDSRITVLEFQSKEVVDQLKKLEQKLEKIMNNDLYHIQTSLTEVGSSFDEKLSSNIRLIGIKNEEIYNRFTERMDKVTDCFVTKDRYKPIEKLVYGGVGLILVAVCGALLTIILK